MQFGLIVPPEPGTVVRLMPFGLILPLRPSRHGRRARQRRRLMPFGLIVPQGSRVPPDTDAEPRHGGRLMRFGVIVPQGWRGDLEGRDFEMCARVARRAEELGFDSIWLYDHLQTRDGVADRLLECWTTLAALARETSRVRLGQIVTCALYRNPGLLAQIASTVDAASGNRVFLGVGAGWDEREYIDFGYAESLPPVRERLAHLERTLVVLRERRGARPILVGGAGEKVLLRLVARYADACNFTDSFDPAFYRHKLGILRAHCEAIGRDSAEIRGTASFSVREQDDVDFAAIAAVGIEWFIVYLDPPTDLARLERFARQHVQA